MPVQVQKEKKRTIPLVVIIIAFIIFWPVGIALTVARIAIDHGALLKNNTKRLLNIAAWAFLVAAAYLIYMGLDETTVWFVYAAALCAGGLCANFYAMRLSKKSDLYKKYIDLIINHRVSDLDAIAQNTSVAYDKLVSDLKSMIAHEYFPGAKLDLENRKIIVPLPAGISGAVPSGPYAVHCSGCGAGGIVTPGEINRCEYCDSFLGG